MKSLSSASKSASIAAPEIPSSEDHEAEIVKARRRLSARVRARRRSSLGAGGAGAAADETVEDDDDMGTGAAMAEDFELELLRDRTENAIVTDGLLSTFGPIIAFVSAHPKHFGVAAAVPSSSSSSSSSSAASAAPVSDNTQLALRSDNDLLLESAILALCKFMCTSSKFWYVH